MIICLIYIGIVPNYVRYCIQQIKNWSSLSIYFITNDIENCKNSLNDYEINYIHPDELKDKNLEIINEKRKYFGLCNWIQGREDLFFTSFLRLYLLENFMKKYNINNVFHLELDNLIYYDPFSFKTQFESKGISYLYEDYGRGCASVFYARDVESLKHLNDTIINYIDMNGGFNSEMGFLGRYIDEHTDKVNILPHVPPEENNTKHLKISDNFESFENGKWIFDSMSIGMWLTGIDRIHSNGIIKKCKSPWIPLDITNIKYKWKLNKKGKKYPVMITKSGNECRIFNLHIHCKDLRPYLSLNFNYNKSKHIVSEISYQHVSNIYLYDDNDIENTNNQNENPTIKYMNINDIPENYDNPAIIYVNSNNLNKLYQNIAKFKNMFTLISNNLNDSKSLTIEILCNILNSRNIKNYYSPNLLINHPKAKLVPIGVKDINKFNLFLENKKNNGYIKEGIYFSFSNNNYYKQNCYDTCKGKGLNFQERKNTYEEYLTELIKYEFAICPLTNLQDSYKLWECFYLGVIPIVLYSPFIEKIKHICKLVILNNWNDLSVNNGIIQYEKLNIYIPNYLKEPIYVEDYLN